MSEKLQMTLLCQYYVNDKKNVPMQGNQAYNCNPFPDAIFLLHYEYLYNQYQDLPTTLLKYHHNLYRTTEHSLHFSKSFHIPYTVLNNEMYE